TGSSSTAGRATTTCCSATDAREPTTSTPRTAAYCTAPDAKAPAPRDDRARLIRRVPRLELPDRPKGVSTGTSHRGRCLRKERRRFKGLAEGELEAGVFDSDSAMACPDWTRSRCPRLSCPIDF